MHPGDLQTISAVATIISAVVALVATVICLKISQQISQLETRIIARLADDYVSREDLRLVCPRANPTMQRQAEGRPC